VGRTLRRLNVLRVALLSLIIVAASYSALFNRAASASLTTPNGLPISAPSPCLTPSASDSSTAQIEAVATNASLSGDVLPLIRNGKAVYMGNLPQTRTLTIELVFAIRNLQQFQSCLASIQDPHSPNYGRFLNATTILPYIPTPGQKTSVVSLLTQRGFNVHEGASPLVIYASATVAKVEKTFGLHMNLYEDSGYTFYAPDSDPKIPQNFLGIVNWILGLNNYSVVRPSETPCGVVLPSYPDCPQGIQAGYSLSNLYASGYNGTGQKVAVIDEPGDPNIQTAINTFDSQYNLPQTTLLVLTPNGPVSAYDPGWASEAAMDVEAVHSVAPGAGIILLYGNGNATNDDIVNLIDYVAINHLANVASNSWTFGCGVLNCNDTALAQAYPTLVSSVDSRLMLDSSMGLTILFASGDSGARPDGHHLGTEFPSSDPNVLAVGATNLVLAGCSITAPFNCSGYGNETGAPISGGGYSGFFLEPSWQSANIGPKSGRAVPDVSMLGFNPGFWVYSTSSNHCGGFGSSAGWFECAGTSLSTPLWAGFLAVALQIRGGKSFGNIGPLLYAVANGPLYSSVFHDITTGSNGYSATTGWDPVTGWGTPIANNLAKALLARGFGQIDPDVFTASESSAWIVMPDYVFGQGSLTHTSAPKCRGSGAQVSDIYATYTFMGALTNEQNEILDTNSAYISQSASSCGQPLTSSSQPLVAVAGPLVNVVTYYYGALSSTGQSQLWLNTTTNCIVRRDTGASVLCNPTQTVTQDYFVMDAFKDTAGRTVYLIWGLAWLGTVAATDFVSRIVLKNPTAFTNSWYVYRWNDATSGPSANSIPDAGDTFTQLAAGP
jgi:hypothetical protein